MSKHAHLYNSHAWKVRRRELLNEEPLCRLCMARGVITMATVADHVQPHHGDLTAFYHGKLQALCKRCHDGAKKQQESTGRIRGGDTHGNPLDAGHHWNKDEKGGK